MEVTTKCIMHLSAVLTLGSRVSTVLHTAHLCRLL